jgi:hypothetical protein
VYPVFGWKPPTFTGVPSKRWCCGCWDSSLGKRRSQRRGASESILSLLASALVNIEPMDLDLQVKIAIYGYFAETGGRPSLHEIAQRVGASSREVTEAYGRLRLSRVLVLDSDGVTIRMAPPFSGVATQHVVKSGSVSYFANCAWDALGIPAALQQPATVHSRCEQSMEPFRLEVGGDGPEPSDWLFYCLVPAAHWRDDIVFT